MLMLATFSQSSSPAPPSLSVSVTARSVMLAHGVYDVHLNWATVVSEKGIRLRWLLLPRTSVNVMSVKSVDVLPSGVWHGKGQ